MDKIKVYLDHCSYNRPFDDQTNLRIPLETQAKLYIQALIRDKKIDYFAFITGTVLPRKNENIKGVDVYDYCLGKKKFYY